MATTAGSLPNEGSSDNSRATSTVVTISQATQNPAAVTPSAINIGSGNHTTESIRNVLVAFDPSRGVATRRVLVRDGFLPDVALAPDGMLWLADQGLPVPGIRIFDPRDDRQITRAPLEVGLPPFSMGFLP